MYNIIRYSFSWSTRRCWYRSNLKKANKFNIIHWSKILSPSDRRLAVANTALRVASRGKNQFRTSTALLTIMMTFLWWWAIVTSVSSDATLIGRWCYTVMLTSGAILRWPIVAQRWPNSAEVSRWQPSRREPNRLNLLIASVSNILEIGKCFEASLTIKRS